MSNLDSSQGEACGSKVTKWRDQAFHGNLSNLLGGRGDTKPQFPRVSDEIITS